MNRPCHNLLVTGGAGFIGGAFIRHLLSAEPSVSRIVNLDVLTYAGNLRNLIDIDTDPRYYFVQGDINDEALVERLCIEHQIDVVVHFAAETHVDKSIDSVWQFMKTNIEGTLHLLEVIRRLPQMHFHHVSTDEVYGSLGDIGSFNEYSRIQPNSPYSASKASSDHFVRAYAHTYGLSCTISHCSNNYGPGQHNEKLIPQILSCLYEGRPIPIYGRGEHIRNWLFVEDHVDAIWRILSLGVRGEVYDIGSDFESTSIDLAHKIIAQYRIHTGRSEQVLQERLQLVNDRPGHDFRYSIDSAKIKREIGWEPAHDFTRGLAKTIDWYLKNTENLQLKR